MRRHAALPFEPLATGPYGLDFFSNDPDLTIGMVKAAGGHNFTGFVGYGLEPSKHPEADEKSKNFENLFQGPDEVTVYVSDLQRTPERYPRERTFWEHEVGVDVVFDGYADNEGMVDLMYHPEPTLLRCINITDAARNTKIELVSYPDMERRLHEPLVWPLRGGLFAGLFWVADLDAAVAALPSATFGSVVEFDDPRDGRVRAVTGLSPSEVRLELRQRVAA